MTYSGGMRIGELTERSGVPSTALRYYEQAGLLPAPSRTSSGYRTYDTEVLPRLKFIKAAHSYPWPIFGKSCRFATAAARHAGTWSGSWNSDERRSPPAFVN
jgi:hypothetical protein